MLVSLGLLASIAVASGAAGEPFSAAPCSPARLYFDGSYYRTVRLSSPPAAGRPVGIGTYVPCSATAPVQTPLRRLRGVRARVALRDAPYPHVVYVAGTLCGGRGGHALLRCLHHAGPKDLIVPPPAFAITEGQYTPLGYTSSCWFLQHGNSFLGSCVDYIWPPSSPPEIAVERSGTLTFQLGFRPAYVALFLHSTDTDSEEIVLQASDATSWHVPEDLPLPALFELRAQGPIGEGAYVGRLVEASGPPSGG